MSDIIATATMIKAVYHLVSFLPVDIDAIVGVARAGLLPASVLSCHLHLPLYVASDSEVVNSGAGTRFKGEIVKPTKVLVVDDSVLTGRTMSRIPAMVRKAFPDATVLTASIYVTPQTRKLVDYYVGLLSKTSRMEWQCP